MRYPAGKQSLLDQFSRDLDELEKTTKLGGSYQRLDPYVITHFQGLRQFELIVFHIESKAWFDQNTFDYEAYMASSRKFVDEGDSVFDLGCNVGVFSVIYGLLVGPTGRVNSFDPFPWNTLATRYNARLNYLENVTTHTVGLGSQQAVLNVHAHDSRTYVATGHETSINIHIEPLSKFAYLKPNVIKIDIEGAESDLFGPDGLDSLTTLERFILELHPHHLKTRDIDPASVLRGFREAGYSLHLNDPLTPEFDMAGYSEPLQLFFGANKRRRAAHELAAA